MKKHGFGLNFKIFVGLLVLVGIGFLAIYVREGGLNLSGAYFYGSPSNQLKVEAAGVGGANLSALKVGDKYKLQVTIKDKPLTNKPVKVFWAVPYSPGFLSANYKLDSKGEIEFTVSSETAPGPYVLQRVSYSFYSSSPDQKLNVLLPSAAGGSGNQEDVSPPQSSLQISVQPVGSADLATLKIGDKYRLKVLFGGKPLVNKSVDVLWNVPIKYNYYTLNNNPTSTSITWKPFQDGTLKAVYNLDGKGEIEFTVSESTTPGAYTLLEAAYLGLKANSLTQGKIPGSNLWVLEPGALTVEVTPVAGANLKALNIGNKYRLKVRWAYEDKAPLAYRQVKAIWSVPYGSGTDSATYTLDKNGEIEFTVSRSTTPGNYVLKSVESATYYAAPGINFTVLSPGRSNIQVPSR